MKSLIEPIEVRVGQSRLIGVTKTPSDIVIEDSGIAKYNLLNPNQIKITGHKAGETVVTMWLTGAKDETTLDFVSYVIKVLPEQSEAKRSGAVRQRQKDRRSPN